MNLSKVVKFLELGGLVVQSQHKRWHVFMGRNLEFSYQKLEDKKSHSGLEFNHFEAEKLTAQCNLKYPLTQLEVYIMRP